MSRSADPLLPVVRIGEVSLPGPAPAMAGGSVVGGLVGRRDRRRPQVPQDLVGPRPRAEA